ncbi:MAG TPA: sulfite exporter TauE/SafE family protein [Anaeromyxobacteraceae bacterium]|nr:sulfite exporter TauE/SafE family protein [Anaeromyxobacteraceae bacterium]
MLELLGGGLGGAAAGVLSGTFGVGGGLILVPALALLLGLPQREAQGVSLAVLLLPVGLPAVLAYHRRGAVRWPLAGFLVTGFVAGVGLGALVANRLPTGPLTGIFALFLVVSAFITGRRRGAPASAGGAHRSNVHGVWIGVIAGCLAGLLGIGGGIVIVPLLVAVVGLTQHEAQGTSLATLLPPIGLPGVLVYARSGGGLPWPLLAAVAIGFALGAGVSARAALRVEGRALARGFSAFLLVLAVIMGARALR